MDAAIGVQFLPLPARRGNFVDHDGVAFLGPARRRGRGTNADVRLWYSRYRSPLLRSAWASVAGMPVTLRMLARMSAWPPSAMRPYGQKASPYTT